MRKLQSVAPKDVRRLRHVFCWISVAARQLTTSELAAAPGVDLRNTEDLFDLCPRSMIRLGKRKPSSEDQIRLPQEEAVNDSSDSETDIATFDHPSVKRFLYSPKIQDSGDNRLSPFFVSEKSVNAELARLMVDHLLAIQQPNMDASSLETTRFLPYAARYWYDHMKNSGIVPGEDEMLSSRLLTLFGDPMSPAYLNWIRNWNPERKTTDFGLTQENCSSPLYMSIFLGLGGISNILIDKGSYINGTGGLMHTALQLASQREETSISQKLIAAGEDTDKAPDDQPTALYIAVDNGNAKLVELLLAAGAKPDANHSVNGSILQLASLRGLKSIVEWLVASGADVNLQSGLFGTALQAAAAAGHNEVVAILMNNGAEPDAVGGVLGTAIQAAETGGHFDVVKQLVAGGAVWDEEGDSVWREAYDRWISSSSMTKVPEYMLLDEPSLRSQTQKMLAGALKILNSPLSDASNAPEDPNKERWSGRKAPHADRLKLAIEVQRQGLNRPESKYYVYRAFFWAALLQFRVEVKWSPLFYLHDLIEDRSGNSGVSTMPIVILIFSWTKNWTL